MPDTFITPARQLLHQPVRNLQGLLLGEIEELVIDLDRGFIAFAVLVHRDPAVPARKRFAIPWSAFSVDAAGGQMRLNLQPEVLREAKGLGYDDASLASSVASV